VFGLFRRPKPTHYYHIYHESLEGHDMLECVLSNLELADLLAQGDRRIVSVYPAYRATINQVADAV